MDEARAAIGAFVGADQDDLALVPNATAGINIVARSLDLRAGDEVVAIDHAYNAATNALEHAPRPPAPASWSSPAVPRHDARPRPPSHSRRRHATHAARDDRPRHERDGARPARRRDRGCPAARGIDGARRRSALAGHARHGLSGRSAPPITPATATSGCPPPRARASSMCDATPGARSARWRSATWPNSPRPGRTRFRVEHDWTGTRTLRHISAFRPPSSSARPAAGAGPALRGRADRVLAFKVSTCCAPHSGSTPPAPESMIAAWFRSAAARARRDAGGGSRAVRRSRPRRPPAPRDPGSRSGPWPQRPGGEPGARIALRAAPYVSLPDLELLAGVLPGVVGATARLG